MAVDIAVLGLEVRSDGVVVASDRLKQLIAEGGKAEQATDKLSTSFQNATKYIQAAVAAMAAWKLTEYAKEATLLAARVETLGVVMKVVGNNAGYTGSQMEAYDKQVQKMGITTQESRANLIKMAGSQMELAKATQLARVAQDAAVIGNINSSEAFGRMIQGIRSGETEILKNIGINVQFEQAYKKAAATLGKTSEQMTGAEKVTARMNAVLDYGKNIAGAYEASMGTAGKQLNSMSRYTEELRLKFGETFTPALSFVVVELTNALKDADTMLGNNKSTVDEWGQNFKSVVVSIAAEITRLSMLIDKAGGSMTSAAMLLFAPGAAMGNENSKKQFERFAQANMDYEARYKAGEDRLARLAMLEMNPGTTGRTSAQEQASIDAAAQAKAKEAAEAAAEAAKKGAEAAKKWASTYAQLRKEIAALNPIMSEHDKKLLDVSARYAELQRKTGANKETLQDLEKKHLQAIETEYQTAEAIKATSREFAEYLRIAGDESAWSQTAESVDEYHKKFRESVEDMDAATKAARDVANGIYDIERAFAEAGQSTAIETFINNLFKLKDVQNATTDINISMAGSDPAAQQMAAIEERYRREKELINEKMAALEDSNLTETAMYRALNDNLLAMASKREKDIADIQRKQSEEGWQGVVGAAQKAFPKLTGLDKAVTAAFKDHTKYRLATEQERAKGAEKLVKDETRSNLSMYSSYAGAAGAVFEGLAATQDTTSRAGFETAKAFNIAAAVMNTAMAITNALATVQPYPAAVAAAAMAGAMGVMQIATIASTTFGGTAQAPTVPSGSFGAGVSGGSSTVGTKIGVALQDPLQAASTDAMILLAESAESASMAIGDLTSVFERIASTFEEGIGASLVSRAYGLYAGSVKATGNANMLDDRVLSEGISSIIFDAIKSLSAASVGLGAATSTPGALGIGVSAWGSWTEEAFRGMFESLLKAQMDEFAKTIPGLEEYAKAGENASDALIRLSTALTAFNDVAELAGITLLEGLSGANMASKIADVMGGQDEMTDAIESYFEAVFTDAEQSAREAEKAQLDIQRAFDRINADAVLQAKQNQQLYTEAWIDIDATTKQLIQIPKTAQQLADELNNVGIQVPKTREEFRNLVNSISSDISKYTHLATTVADVQLSSEYQKQADSAASTFAALMNVSESFGIVMESADAAAEAAKELAGQRTQLEIEIMKLTGRELEATAIERQIELDAMDSSLRPLQERIYALQDEAEAAEKAAEAARALATAQSKFNTNFSQELNGYSASSVQGIKDQITEVFTDAVNALDDGLIQYDVQGIKDQITQTFTSVWSAAAPDIQQQLTAILQAMPTSWSSGDAVRDWYNSIRNSVGDNLKPAIESVSALVAQLASDMDGVARDSGIARLQDQLRGIAVDMPASFADGSAVRQWYANLVTNAEVALQPALLSVQDLVVQLAAAIDTDIANAAKVTPVDNSAAEYAAKVAEQRRQMEIQIMELSGDAAGALAATRAIELASLDATLQPLQQRIWQLSDEAEATAKAAEIASQRSSLEIQIMELEGKSRDALLAQRRLDVLAMDASLRPLQVRVWALQDEAEATEKANAIAATRRDMELTIMELEGRTAEATTLRRADELAALDASLRPLQQRIWQLEDEKTAADSAADAIRGLNDALSTAESDLRAAFSAEKDRLTEAYQAELEALNTRLDSAKTVVADLTDSLNMLTSARKAMRLEDEAYQRNQYLIARQQLSTVLDQAAGGDLSGVKNMGESLDILTSQGKEAYANSTDYQRDFYIVTDSIDKLEGYTKKALTPAEEAVTELERQSRQLTDNHNAQMRAMDNQLNALLGIDTTAKTIAQALSAYNAAKAAADAAAKASATNTATSAAAQRYGIYHTVGGATIFHQDGTSNYLAGADAYDRLTSIFSSAPRFALGGITSGISIAGEAGPEAVVPLPDGRRIPVQMTGAADNRELVEELRALRAEVIQLKAATGEVSKATQKTAKLIDQWDGDGMPEVRTA